jgi:hypothetical protein
MKKISFALVVLVAFTTCEKVEYSQPPMKLTDVLEGAYWSNSLTEYHAFLGSWATIPAKELKELETETEKNVYRVFQTVYSPFDISRLGNHEWGEMYGDLNYVVVQNRVRIDHAYGQFDSEYVTDTIIDFRPEIEIPDKTILYLTENYGEAIYDFLGVEVNPYRPEDTTINALTSEETIDRLEFLNQHLAILIGHWGWYFHIETHPEVTYISFNKEEDKAMAYFRVGYMFGTTYLSKNLEWQLDSSAITAIEK